MSFRTTPGQQLARTSARHDGRDLESFDPKRYHRNQIVHDAIIKEAKLRFNETFREYGLEEAKKIKEWDTLHRAAADKLAEQQLFVGWWQANVTIGHGAGRGNKKSRVPGAFSLSEAERLTGMKHQRVSELGKRLQDEAAYFRHLVGAVYFAAFLEIPPTRGTMGTGENEWFTPESYITLVRKVLGGIDLDPATSAVAQKIVRARKFHTEETDGLKHNWRGRVWLNPPYGQPTIQNFVSKMVAEYKAKRVIAAIMLTHNFTDTTWFHDAVNTAKVICFTRGRVKFYKADGSIAAPTQGQAFFYFGRNPARFIKAFKEVGFIVRLT
jgi:ParB family chromosome partitioning protein